MRVIPIFNAHSFFPVSKVASRPAHFFQPCRQHFLALLFLPGLLLGSRPLGAQSRPTLPGNASQINLSGDLNVKRLLQDRDGFLWLGTDLGLHRFDGYTTQLISTVPREGLRLADNEILSLYEDRQGCLWIGTGNGLHRLDRSRTAVQTYLVEAMCRATGRMPLPACWRTAGARVGAAREEALSLPPLPAKASAGYAIPCRSIPTGCFRPL
jgi:ligand-binding sensor domain-containing protein